MSIPFSELDKPVLTKEQILAKIYEYRKYPAFYDGQLRGDMAHFTAESQNYWGDEEFEDVPF